MKRAGGAINAAAAHRCRHFDPAWLARRLRALAGPLAGRRLCVAFSGGIDSSALLHALLALRRRERFRLRAVHVNHGLQQDAAGWARAAAAQARRWRVPLRTLRVQVAAAGSVEAAARAARYAALAAQLEAGEFLLSAHNQDDQLETVLLQLVRGAGIAGLAAMPGRAPFAAGELLRPLLPVPRVLLRAYLEGAGVTWCEDPSNADERFDRSFLRQCIVPLLRARWPAVAATVSRSARHAAEAHTLLAAMADRGVDTALDGAALRLSVLRRFGPALRRALLRQWIARCGAAAPDERRLEELAEVIVHARGEAQPALRWGTHELRRHGDRLYLGTPLPPPPRTPLAWQWRPQQRLELPDGAALCLRTDPHGEIALTRLPPLLQVRFRVGGERLPAAFGRRALKDLLQQRRLPPWLRARLPLLCVRSRIVAVPGMWLAPEYAATARDAHRAHLVWEPPAGAARGD
ncbi:MAG: tRNA lysidine(34) synthetase TilS [Gammaproteobacteria bacterium]|nr:tRNA lysidine(34) synthetase TilS [Gammaproteobacteria bacterium]